LPSAPGVRRKVVATLDVRHHGESFAMDGISRCHQFTPEWALGADLIEVNAGRGVKVAAAKVAPEKRLLDDAADPKRIFGSPIFTQGARPQARGGQAAFWLPLLAPFTGARIEELAQAHAKHVKNIEGVHVLQIFRPGRRQAPQE
jgi:hypothetical protein